MPRKAIMQPNYNFLDHFDSQFAPLLGPRSATFRAIFQYLLTIHSPPYLIVETGMARKAGNWQGDGMSTVLWDRFVSALNGRVVSIDIDPGAIDVTRPMVSSRTNLVCNDSVATLCGLADIGRAQLIYLDSYDLDTSDPHPSAMHHLYELAAIFSNLAPGTLIVVDDCISDEVGKHKYVKGFFDRIGVRPLFRGYQTGWVKP
jgi:hypothetical protein